MIEGSYKTSAEFPYKELHSSFLEIAASIFFRKEKKLTYNDVLLEMLGEVLFYQTFDPPGGHGLVKLLTFLYLRLKSKVTASSMPTAFGRGENGVPSARTIL